MLYRSCDIQRRIMAGLEICVSDHSKSFEMAPFDETIELLLVYIVIMAIYCTISDIIEILLECSS